MQFVRLRFHAYLQFAQGIKVIQYAKQHNDQMLVSVKTLHIRLAAFCFTANLHDFSRSSRFNI